MAAEELTTLGGYTLGQLTVPMQTGTVTGQAFTLGNTPLSKYYADTRDEWYLSDNFLIQVRVSATTSNMAVFKYENNDWVNIYQYSNYRNNTTCYDVLFFIDEANQTGLLYFVNYSQSSNNTVIAGTGWTNELYGLIKGVPQPYNWQSVPSISGKNGILQSLVQIKEEALNDGEPVSEATVLSFDSLGNINIPSVIDEQMPVDPTNLTSIIVSYLIPKLTVGTYSYIKLAIKIGSIPKDIDDADMTIDISEPTSILRIGSITVSDLEENTHYYFVLFAEDSFGSIVNSDPEDCIIGEIPGTVFDYTGSIQEFTAPETGMYSLETWGAQGQSDGSVRGGYGAYSYAEAFLTEGQKLYIGVGGQNGYNGGGNFTAGNIRNIAIPDFNQSIIMDYSLWTNDWDGGRVAVGSIPKTFTLGYDFLGLVMNATLGTESVLIYEKNGVKIYGMRDNRNASYGGYYKYSVYIKDGDEIVAGSQYPDVYSPQSWFIAQGFDRRDSMYNSNVWSRIQALYLGFGVDDEARLGYLVGCTKWHQGYYQGVYINNDSFTSKKISNNTAQYGTYCNSAKLYEALKKMAGE